VISINRSITSETLRRTGIEGEVMIIDSSCPRANMPIPSYDPSKGHGNDPDTEGTLREELTREPFLVIAGVH
jgi:hypothetical protein